MTERFLRTPSGKELVVLSRADWEALVEKAEDYIDIASIKARDAAYQRGEIEAHPAELVYSICDGANPIRAFRDHRGLTVEALAKAAGLSRAYVTQIETGVRTGTAKTLGKLAKALGVDVELLIWGK